MGTKTRAQPVITHIRVTLVHQVVQHVQSLHHRQLRALKLTPLLHLLTQATVAASYQGNQEMTGDVGNALLVSRYKLILNPTVLM